MSARRFPEFYSPERETSLKGKKFCAGERNWNVAPLTADVSGASVLLGDVGGGEAGDAGRLFHDLFIQFSSGIHGVAILFTSNSGAFNGRPAR